MARLKPPRRRWSSLFSLSLLVCVAASSLHAAQLAVRVQTNTPAEIDLPWPYDDSALQEPRGYNHHGVQARHILRQLIIENPGPKPITGAEVLVNGKDWRAALLPPPAELPRALFTAWTHARSHAASGMKAAQNPWQMLRFWGYTLCGEDTRAFGTLLAERGIAGRSVPLNGHVAGEYSIDGRWSVIDGDQNIVYLNLDNQTLASYEEIRADPFLALRTKPFGRFAKPSLAASQFNTGLFEYIEPGPSKPFKQKQSKDAPPPALTIYPGERLIYHYDQWPKTQVGDPKAPEWQKAAPSALRLLELQVVPKARGWKKGPLTVQVDHPIVAAQNLDTGEWTPVSPTELVFSCAVAVTSEFDRISVWMQRSQVSFPAFKAGANRIAVQGETLVPMTVRFIYDANNLPPRPAPPGFRSFMGSRGPTGIAEFLVTTEPDCDRIWWQIAAEPAFRFVAPNLEGIEKTHAPLQQLDQVVAAGSPADPLITHVELDALSNTFINPGLSDYYARVKTARNGVWSEWSRTVQRKSLKRATPTDLSVSSLPGDRVRLEWKGVARQFSIFSSNRLDFLPDVYAEEQITSMRGLEVQAKRPNSNRIAVVNENAFEFKPTGRYIRIIGQSGEEWSNPSALFTLPDELCKDLPPPVVFQVRWTRDESADPPDIYVGEERALRP